MDDLIRREDAIKAIRTWKIRFAIPSKRNFAKDRDVFQDIIDRVVEAQERGIMMLPSAQPEIIRCKDCKHWIRIKRTNRYWCKTDDGLYDLNPSPDDFCSRAERRTDGSD